MTRIIYKIKDGIGEIRACSGDGLRLTVVTKPGTDGYITLAGITKRLSCGEASFNLERVPDGDYTPTLVGGECAIFEPVRKLSGKVFPLPTPDSTVRHLLERVDSLEEKTESLEKELEELERLLSSRIIF